MQLWVQRIITHILIAFRQTEKSPVARNMILLMQRYIDTAVNQGDRPSKLEIARAEDIHSMPQTDNVVHLFSRCQLAPKPDPQYARAEALARSAALLTGMISSRICTKEDLRQAVLLLELTNMNSRLLIDQVESAETKARLLADLAIIDDMLRTARDRIACL